MNDIKKLIQMLKEYQKPYIGHDYIFYGIEFCNPQVQMCIEALEKQMARNPVNRCATFLIAECPRCNGTVSFHHKHCHWCGQKLDWSEAENE